MTKINFYKLMKAYYFSGNTVTSFAIEWVDQKLKEEIQKYFHSDEFIINFPRRKMKRIIPTNDDEEFVIDFSRNETKRIAYHIHSEMQKIIPTNDDEKLALDQTNINGYFDSKKFDYAYKNEKYSKYLKNNF